MGGAGSRFGYELALEWIDAAEEHIAAAGWCTLGNIAALKPDTELSLPAFTALLARVAETINTAPNRVKQTMNGFIIAVGAYILPLTNEAIATANNIGTVEVDMNGTACKVPAAVEYINKIKARGSLGKKKKTVKC